MNNSEACKSWYFALFLKLFLWFEKVKRGHWEGWDFARHFYFFMRGAFLKVIRNFRDTRLTGIHIFVIVQGIVKIIFLLFIVNYFLIIPFEFPMCALLYMNAAILLSSFALDCKGLLSIELGT